MSECAETSEKEYTKVYGIKVISRKIVGITETPRPLGS